MQTEENIPKETIHLTKEAEKYIKKKEKERSTLLKKLEQVENSIAKSEKEYENIQSKMTDNKNKVKKILVVQEDIDKIIPLLDQAKEKIQQISVKQLDEIKNYKKPPERVKICLEAVFLLLEQKQLVWEEIIRKLKDMITSVLLLDWQSVKQKTLNLIQKNYLNKKEWNIEKIRKASMAVGPLADWLENEIIYIKLQKNLSPYREKLKLCNKEMQKLKKREKQILKRFKQLAEEKKKLNIQISTLENEIKEFFESQRLKSRLKQQIEKIEIGIQCDLIDSEEWTYNSQISLSEHLSDVNLISDQYHRSVSRQPLQSGYQIDSKRIYFSKSGKNFQENEIDEIQKLLDFTLKEQEDQSNKVKHFIEISPQLLES